MRHNLPSIMLALLLWTCACGAAAEPLAGLKVTGLAPHPLSLTAESIAAMPHVSVTTKDRSGKQITYAGVTSARRDGCDRRSH